MASLAERLGRLSTLDANLLLEELLQLQLVLQSAAASPLDSAARQEVIACRPLLKNVLAGRRRPKEKKKEEAAGWSSDSQANWAKLLADVVRENASAEENNDDQANTSEQQEQEGRECEPDLARARLACLVASLSVCLGLPPKEPEDTKKPAGTEDEADKCDKAEKTESDDGNAEGNNEDDENAKGDVQMRDANDDQDADSNNEDSGKDANDDEDADANNEDAGNDEDANDEDPGNDEENERDEDAETAERQADEQARLEEQWRQKMLQARQEALLRQQMLQATMDEWWVVATRSFDDPLLQELGVALLDVGWNDPVGTFNLRSKINALQRTADIFRDAEPPAELALTALSFLHTLDWSNFGPSVILMAQYVGHTDPRVREGALKPDIPSKLSFYSADELPQGASALFVALRNAATDAQLSTSARLTALLAARPLKRCAEALSLLNADLLRTAVELVLSSGGDKDALVFAKEATTLVLPAQHARALLASHERALEVLRSNPGADVGSLLSPDPWRLLRDEVALLQRIGDEIDLERGRENDFYGRDDQLRRLRLWRKSQGSRELVWDAMRLFHRNQFAKLLLQMLELVSGNDGGHSTLVEWSPANHKLFPAATRNEIFSLLCIWRRGGDESGLGRLPVEALHAIVRWTAGAAPTAALSAIVKQLRTLTCDHPDRGEPLNLLIRRQKHFKNRDERLASYIVARGRTIAQCLNRKRKRRVSNGSADDEAAEEGGEDGGGEEAEEDDPDAEEEEDQDDDENAHERINVKMSHIASVASHEDSTAETQEDRDTNLAIANAMLRLRYRTHATIVPDICVILLNVGCVDPRDSENGFDMRFQLQDVASGLDHAPGNRAVEEAFAAGVLLNAINFTGGDSQFSMTDEIGTLWVTYPDSAVVKLHCLMAIRESFPYRIPFIAVSRDEIAKAVEAFPDSCGIQSCGKLLLALYDGKAVVTNAIYDQEFDGYDPAWIELGEEWRLVLLEDPKEAYWESTADLDGYAS
eukprot:TRINITY_DN275_c0_g4_i1.p1 TRINITY_DN275_c0_g4~~TRINITY_DN275_c0_g4_i1.p1  ORF type:complete len:996 (+),score=300.08 TRINITY_DN275_c0_g4_i1:157-3144(+)